MQTNVTTVYTKTLNVSVSSKSGVTLWTTGSAASQTVRIPVGEAAVIPVPNARSAYRRAASRKARVKS